MSVKVDAGKVRVEAGRVTTTVLPGLVLVTTDVWMIVVAVPDCVTVCVNSSVSVKVDAGKVCVEAGRVRVCVLAGAVRVTVDVSVTVVIVPDCVIVCVKLSISVNVEAGKVSVWVMYTLLAGRVEYSVVSYV